MQYITSRLTLKITNSIYNQILYIFILEIKSKILIILLMKQILLLWS